MARTCEICNKGVAHGSKVSHSNKKSKRIWSPNIKRVRAIVEGSPKTINVCTKCIKSGKIQRNV
ncbi:MAG: 50S ribosomal protein L28 [Clostridia bacterium]|nr:50S ribosomal protein L28 [Clostridia bacterium]